MNQNGNRAPATVGPATAGPASAGPEDAEPVAGAALASDVAARTAARTLAARAEGYAQEVRRLLDAGLAEMRRRGTSSRPRVADIVAAAGLSNDAFYRHFPSKDALVAALIEDGAERLASYAAHQMGKEATAEGKVRRWVTAILAQTSGEVAATTLAVLSNATGPGHGTAAGRHPAAAQLAALVREPFAELGSADPDLDAQLAAHATLGVMSDYLWRRESPGPAEAERIIAFCLRAARPGSGG
ncbi:MAG: TetR/AcrR family transcriptional regulator [Frankia sp.]|nr:TetR/AcrR family transcriptional regulator [Frankia sp.]